MMKVVIFLSFVLLSGIISFCSPVSDDVVQDETNWTPATVNGVVLGSSKYDDIIRLWGKPANEVEFAGDPTEPEDGTPTPELLTELWYRNIEIDGEKVNAGVLIGNETRLIKAVSYNIEGFTKDEAIRKFGSDYYLTTTQESTCIEISQKRNHDRKLDQMAYPISLVYPQNGMSISIRNDNALMMVNYADKCK